MTVEFTRIEGEPKAQKIAVVFFNKNGERPYKTKDADSQQSSRACGECIDAQVKSLSEEGKPVVINLTVVADCMYSKLAPRGLYVSARNDLCPSFSADSAACSGVRERNPPGLPSIGKEVDGDVPAQVFGSGHMIANVGYGYYPKLRGDKAVKEAELSSFQLFFAMLP